MASTLIGSHANGENGTNGAPYAVPRSMRFSDIPPTIDIPVADQDDEAVEISLEDLTDDPTELCTLFEMEEAARGYWMTVALAYAKQRKVDFAIEMLIRGANAMQVSNPREKLSIVTCLCWMYLWKSRDAPRVAPEGSLVSEAKTKEYWLQEATTTLNEASRINPAFPPLFLARGVLLLLRASLQTPTKAIGTAPGTLDPEKVELLRAAAKSFEDAMRVSQNKNMLAVMGKARTYFSLGKYAEALAGYQDVLAKMPNLVDPDPRIGIGCCFWQLGYKDDAKLAWERCLEINPESKFANILLGLYYLDSSGHVPTNSPEFIRLYKKAMTEYTQKSFKLDKDLPLTCVTFANYFLSRKSLANVDSLAHKAIQYTDVNAIASDGWYLLARKEHHAGNIDRASDYYRRADDARGGTERGYLPAKFGAAQLSVLKNDFAEAKLRLEKMIQQSKSYEAMILLGTLYAEEVFANQHAAVKEDKGAEAKKATHLLESVRAAWKDPKKNLSPDAAILLNLARLYETENPEKALQCLEHVEQLELEQVAQSQSLGDTEDEAKLRAAQRKFLPPQLLNNIGCFYSQAERHEEASNVFEAALSSCIRIGESNEDTDTDALVTTISFNLGRSYESRGMPEQAVAIYEGLLKRHEGYTDARTRLAYIKLRMSPNKEGPDTVAKLYQENPTDLEVRALYGWFLGKVNSKKRPANVAEDPELRLYKHTLQNYDKHDRYALVGMGNMYLVSAREMHRETEQDKQKRGQTYSRAVEFFEKALQLDPKNAYAAQGIAIALVEDKKDFKGALQIFIKVKDTIKDPNVFVNLGHIYAELKQYSKAIESYEMALSKEGKANDAGILSCLGRTWLNRGRSERNLDAYKMALECAQKALAIAPEQVHFKFNVAFVQIQLAMTINSLSETQRSSLQLEDAAEGLEKAIEALDAIAKSDQTPYPKHDIEQRANMARNTQRRQLERAIASQKEYEEKNKGKIAAALELRQAELRRREEAKRKTEEEARVRQEKIRKEREAIAAQDRALAEQRAAEEAERARMEEAEGTGSEAGGKPKRKRRPQAKSGGEAGERKRRSGGGGRSRRSKKGGGDDEDGEDSGEEQQRRPPKKRQKLTSRKETTKYKSAEVAVDSDDDEEEGEEGEDELDRADRRLARSRPSPSDDEDQAIGDDVADKMDVDANSDVGDDDDDGIEEAAITRRQQPKRARRGMIVEESDDDEEIGGESNGKPDDGDNAATPDKDDADEEVAAADTTMAGDADDDDE